MDGNNMNMDNMNNVEPQVAEYTYAAEGTYEAPVEAAQGSNALAIVALICGILSIVCCLCSGLGAIPGIVAIICGILGIKKCPKAGMAKAGLICGIVGVVLGIITLIVALATGGGIMAWITEMANDSYYYY